MDCFESMVPPPNYQESGVRTLSRNVGNSTFYGRWRLYRRLCVFLSFAALLTGCEALLFHPQKTLVHTPADADLVYETVELTSRDGIKLHSWWLPAKDATERMSSKSNEPRSGAKGSILYLHGNAQNIGAHLANVYWLPEQGYNVMLLDYRGFGQSGGSPSLDGALLDVEAALTWFERRQQHSHEPVFLLGQSLGASLGGYLVGSEPRWQKLLRGVVLDAGISRYSTAARDVAKKGWLTWFLQPLAAWSMPDDHDLLDAIGKISPVPLLIIHGESDQIVDVKHADVLYEHAQHPKALFRYKGRHIQTFMLEEGRQHLLEFFDTYGTSQPKI